MDIIEFHLVLDNSNTDNHKYQMTLNSKIIGGLLSIEEATILKKFLDEHIEEIRDIFEEEQRIERMDY